ncbi:MAG TPA: hypothetical protein VGB43_08265 [Flavobacterium sp.]
MKKLILMLLLAGSLYSQEQVFNVQKYCVDEAPFKKGECDITGNEYSFVFMDLKRQTVVFFFTDMRLEYKIIDSALSATDPSFTHYTLENGKGRAELKVNKQKTRMEFLYPNSHIYLTVGKTTKL